jgi:hypothetical protein
MAEIISFAERRNAKIRDRLMTFALQGEAVIIETRTGLVRADRLICRDHVAEIINSWGESVVIGYGEVRDVRPGVIPQLSTVSAAGDWVVPTDCLARQESSQELSQEHSRVLAFARPGRRR